MSYKNNGAVSHVGSIFFLTGHFKEKYLNLQKICLPGWVYTMGFHDLSFLNSETLINCECPAFFVKDRKEEKNMIEFLS